MEWLWGSLVVLVGGRCFSRCPSFGVLSVLCTVSRVVVGVSVLASVG